jgi:hypothetical protein
MLLVALTIKGWMVAWLDDLTIGNIWNEVAVYNLKYHPGICLQRLRQIIRNFGTVSVPLRFEMTTSWIQVRNGIAWATLHSRVHTSHDITTFLCFQTMVIMSPLLLVLEVRQKHVSFVTHLLSPCFYTTCHFQTLLTSTLKMEAVSSFETLVTTYQNEQYHEPEDHNICMKLF